MLKSIHFKHLEILYKDVFGRSKNRTPFSFFESNKVLKLGVEINFAHGQEFEANALSRFEVKQKKNRRRVNLPPTLIQYRAKACLKEKHHEVILLVLELKINTAAILQYVSSNK